MTMSENIKKFVEEVEKNKELNAKLQTLNEPIRIVRIGSNCVPRSHDVLDQHGCAGGRVIY